MRLSRLSPITGLFLLGTALAPTAGQAAPLPARSGQPAVEAPVILAGDREAAAVAGAGMGGAFRAMIGSSLAPRPAPPPPAGVVGGPVGRGVIEERPVRRIVEVEDAPPPVVEECVTRRTRVYDPDFDETIVRKERRCR